METEVCPLQKCEGVTLPNLATADTLPIPPAKQMECFKIGKKVGNVKYDEPSLVEPV